MPGTYSKITTVNTADTITASERNAEHDNHINNCDFAGLGDYSASNSQMQSTTDPYPGGAESLATDGKGELERLRYQFKTQLGLSQWYHDVTTPYETFLAAICGYRRPRLIWQSTTAVDVENNTGTSNQTTILFKDGTTRSVTEDTSSTHKYRRFLITATAEYTSGTEDSGLHSSLSEANNTSYAIYAVKSVIDSTKFVLVGDTTLPTQANFSTLNTRYATNGWVYLETIFNGDNSGATGDILTFVQHGAVTCFRNVVTGNQLNMTGIRMASNTGVSSLTYTYAGGTGAAQIPGHILMVNYAGAAGAGSGNSTFTDSAGTVSYAELGGAVRASLYTPPVSASNGFKIANGTTVNMDIYLTGFIDSVLAAGTNPFL